jgi:cyclic pyranopterin phosphate synthase
MTDPRPTHYDEHGRARMVDVSAKPVTTRKARAEGLITLSADTVTAIRQGTVPKGEPFEAARLAGIAAAKRTADLIPLCHPLRLNIVDINVRLSEDEASIVVQTLVSADERTGVEMEALTACSVALLTVYDMLKAIDKSMVIGPIRLLEKTGGKSDYTAPPVP